MSNQGSGRRPRRNGCRLGRSRLVSVGPLAVLSGLVALCASASASMAASTGSGGSRTAHSQVQRSSVAPADEISACLEQTTVEDGASVSLSSQKAVCAAVLSDLTGIGHDLDMDRIAPAYAPLSSPLTILFAANNLDAHTPIVTTYEQTKLHSEPCKLTFYPLFFQFTAGGGAASATGIAFPPGAQALIAHEIVHCYQRLIFTSMDVPGWVTEGSATYLATLYTGHPEPGTASFWRVGWLGAPNTSLSLRSYDAVGWYSLVAHVTHSDLWPKMAQAWRAYTSDGASSYIADLGGDSTAVEKAWGPSLLNKAGSDWGNAWVTPGIGVPESAQPRETALKFTAETASNGGNVSPRAAVVDTEDSISADLIRVSVTDGYASAHDNTGHGYLGFTDMAFCLRRTCDEATVSCSGGSPLRAAPLSQPFVLAFSSGSNEAHYRISIVKPGESCGATSSTTTPTTTIALTGCNYVPPPCRYISAAEVERIYRRCVTSFSYVAVGNGTGSAEKGCSFGLKIDGQVKAVVVEYLPPPPPGSAQGPYGCLSGKAGQGATYSARTAGGGAVLVESEVGTCAEAADVAGIAEARVG